MKIMSEPCKPTPGGSTSSEAAEARKVLGSVRDADALVLLQSHAFGMGLVSRTSCENHVQNLACRPQLEQHHLRGRCCSSVRGLQAAREQSEPAQAGVHHFLCRGQCTSRVIHTYAASLSCASQSSLW